MKRFIAGILPILLVWGLFSCKNEGDLPQRGECMPTGVTIDLKANAAVAPVVDQVVATLCEALGLPIKTLTQFNQAMSALASQTLVSKVKSIEFISETELAVTLADGTRGVGQYNLKEGMMTWAVPSEVTGLPIPVPIQMICVTDGSNVRFLINKEMIDGVIGSPLFDVVMALLEGPLGGKISADAIRQLLDMMETVTLSVDFKNK